jgi:hypothetical protein
LGNFLPKVYRSVRGPVKVSYIYALTCHLHGNSRTVTGLRSDTLPRAKLQIQNATPLQTTMQLLNWLSGLLLAVAVVAKDAPTELGIETTYTPADCSKKAQKGDSITVHYVGTWTQDRHV